jgi:hypothetical protein
MVQYILSTIEDKGRLLDPDNIEEEVIFRNRSIFDICSCIYNNSE